MLNREGRYKLLEELVIKIIQENGAIKAIELVTEFISRVHRSDDINYLPSDLDKWDVVSQLDRLVSEKKIREVEYTRLHSLGSDIGRVKSIYFPATTDLRIVK